LIADLKRFMKRIQNENVYRLGRGQEPGQGNGTFKGKLYKVSMARD